MLGRFTRPDPANSFSLFNPQSFNRYAYVGNNPVNYVDPFGLAEVSANSAPSEILQEYCRRTGIACPTGTFAASATVTAKGPSDFSVQARRFADRVAYSLFAPAAGLATGSSRRPFRDAALLGVMALTSGMSSASSGGLVHLTTQEGLAGISATGTIVGSRGIFAVGSEVLAEGTALRMARTGLSSAATEAAVAIPSAAARHFSRVLPLGPYSAWKAAGGVYYAPAGSLNLATGELATSGALLGPRALVYGPDAMFWAGAAAVAGTE